MKHLKIYVAFGVTIGGIGLAWCLMKVFKSVTKGIENSSNVSSGDNSNEQSEPSKVKTQETTQNINETEKNNKEAPKPNNNERPQNPVNGQNKPKPFNQSNNNSQIPPPHNQVNGQNQPQPFNQSNNNKQIPPPHNQVNGQNQPQPFNQSNNNKQIPPPHNQVNGQNQPKPNNQSSPMNTQNQSHKQRQFSTNGQNQPQINNQSNNIQNQPPQNQPKQPPQRPPPPQSPTHGHNQPLPDNQSNNIQNQPQQNHSTIKPPRPPLPNIQKASNTTPNSLNNTENANLSTIATEDPFLNDSDSSSSSGLDQIDPKLNDPIPTNLETPHLPSSQQPNHAIENGNTEKSNQLNGLTKHEQPSQEPSADSAISTKLLKLKKIIVSKLKPTLTQEEKAKVLSNIKNLILEPVPEGHQNEYEYLINKFINDSNIQRYKEKYLSDNFLSNLNSNKHPEVYLLRNICTNLKDHFYKNINNAEDTLDKIKATEDLISLLKSHYDKNENAIRNDGNAVRNDENAIRNNENAIKNDKELKNELFKVIFLKNYALLDKNLGIQDITKNLHINIEEDYKIIDAKLQLLPEIKKYYTLISSIVDELSPKARNDANLLDLLKVSFAPDVKEEQTVMDKVSGKLKNVFRKK